MNKQASRNDSNYYMRLLLNRVPSMLAYWDRDLRCRFANRAYERWFGVDADLLIGTSIKDLLGPELFAINEPYIQGALRGEQQEFERLVPGPDGVKRPSLAIYIPDVVDGEVRGFLAQVTEVTKLKDVEQALRSEVAARERAYELLCQSDLALREAQRLGQIGSWEWDVDANKVSWSPELYHIFGRDPDAKPITLEDHAALYEPESWSRVFAAIQDTMKTGTPYTVELAYRRPDGGSGWLEARGEAVHDKRGRICKLRGTVQETSMRRHAQEARLQRDLAEAANRNKTLFLSRASHELRTPLNAILGFAQLIALSAAADPKHHEWAHLIMSSGRQMLSLVDELLDLSSAEAGHMQVNRIRLDLGALVQESVSRFSEMSRQAGIQILNLVSQSEPIGVWGDAKRIGQVLTNLLSNAIKYNRKGGQVTLSAAKLEGTVELTVSDTGGGLSEEQMARAFTPFDRLGAEATQIEGSGVGLALTQKLVELMGGRIRIESQAGVGSSLIVTLMATTDEPGSTAHTAS